MADPIVNFFSSTLVGGYSDSDTSLTLATGSGANLPDPSVDGEFNLVIYNESEIFVTTTFDGGSTDTRQDLASTNPEIVRVTARTGDVLTVTRAQEGTTASAKAAENTYRVILASTKKVFDDINTAIANVNVTNLTGVEELTFDSTGDEEFGLPAGTTAQRPATPSVGYMRWNSTDSRIEVYNGTRWAGLSEIGFQQETLGVATATTTVNDSPLAFQGVQLEYVVVAGGGGGSARYIGGGGGAGGFRSSVSGDSSGGGASAESSILADLATSYTVTVGAGGNGGSPGDPGTSGSNGSNSVFSTVTSTGGGGGGQLENGKDGGCGGGGSGRGDVDRTTGGSGTANQGFNGGNGLPNTSGTSRAAGGGGGAGEIGGNGVSADAGDGGDGVISTILSSSDATSLSVGEVSGSDVYFAGGGGGGGATTGAGGLGGLGGGGGGRGFQEGGLPEAGTANTGGGGGGEGDNQNTSANGGSGVVILRYPSSRSISVGAGLTSSTVTEGANKITVFTAGTGNVSWS